MKIIIKNSNLVFQKYKLDRDIIIPGKLTQSVSEVTTVDITVNKGTYLITLPLISELSLQYYTSSYIYKVVKNGRTLHGAVGTNSYSLRYLIVNAEEDGTQISFFARVDKDTNATFHIKEIKLPDVSYWETFYSKTFNVTEGKGLYDFLNNEAYRFKPNHIYAASFSDATKISKLDWFLGTPGDTDFFISTDLLPQLAVSTTDIVTTNKTQVGASYVIGTGSVKITIYEYDASDILQ